MASRLVDHHQPSEISLPSAKKKKKLIITIIYTDSYYRNEMNKVYHENGSACDLVKPIYDSRACLASMYPLRAILSVLCIIAWLLSVICMICGSLEPVIPNLF